MLVLLGAADLPTAGGAVRRGASGLRLHRSSPRSGWSRSVRAWPMSLRPGGDAGDVRRLSRARAVARAAARGRAAISASTPSATTAACASSIMARRCTASSCSGSPVRERTPTTYYAPRLGRRPGDGGARPGCTARRRGSAWSGWGPGRSPAMRSPAQRWRFYEIDPAVVRIARDTGQFTYLSRCLPHPDIRIGDARISLGAEPPDEPRPARARCVLVGCGADAPDDARGVRDLCAGAAAAAGCCWSISRTASSIWSRWSRPRRRRAAGGAADAIPAVDAAYPRSPRRVQWIALSRDPATIARVGRRRMRDWVPLRPAQGLRRMDRRLFDDPAAAEVATARRRAASPATGRSSRSAAPPRRRYARAAWRARDKRGRAPPHGRSPPGRGR